MIGVAVRAFGEPSVLRLEELAAPTAAAGEVLIDVDAAGVNFGDVLVRRGEYFGGGALPLVPGWEVVGRVADPGASGLAVGARVVALLAAGGYAERVAAPAKDVVRVPDDVPDAVALAMVIQGATAWRLLQTPVVVGAGDAVLVSGGGSGVTHLVVQLARARGAGRVVVLCSSERKARIVGALGAEAVLCPAGQDGAEALAAALGPASVDHVIDMVGSPVLEAMLRCLRPGGRAVVYGAAGGTPARINSGALLRFGWQVAGLWLGHEHEEPFARTLGRLFDLHREGRLSPTLGPTLPLADAAQAHRLVEARQAVGKVVLACR
ncbi:quinone oxidoreductase family protein [Patulibacter sp. S7RM1-6]